MHHTKAEASAAFQRALREIVTGCAEDHHDAMRIGDELAEALLSALTDCEPHRYETAAHAFATVAGTLAAASLTFCRRDIAASVITMTRSTCEVMGDAMTDWRAREVTARRAALSAVEGAR